MHKVTLQFENVTFGFGDREPLFRRLDCILSTEEQGGKIFALMGPSGVGKTTFCDLAMGLRYPQSGSVTFVPGSAHRAFIPQKAVIFEELSIQENIECLRFSKELGRTFDPGKTPHAVDSLGLSEVLRSGTHASQLSGGEAQRVMLARVQTVDCNVLVLDEPCSFLDNRVKGTFLDALRLTADESRLLALFVTHVWDEARAVADEVLFFHQRPDRGVSIFRDDVSHAERRPPTVDAMYAIHWPYCALADFTAAPSLRRMAEREIPSGARFAGIYPAGATDQDEWATKLVNYLAKADLSALMAGLSKLAIDKPRLTASFYDAGGVLLKANEVVK